MILEKLKSNILIRFLVGSVFLSEGIQKFLFPLELGVGRFKKIGIIYPQVMAPIVGTTEIICGLLTIIGFYTRISVIPLLAVICTAIITTKIPMISSKGIWSMLHEGRTDYAMLMCIVFLLINERKNS